MYSVSDVVRLRDGRIICLTDVANDPETIVVGTRRGDDPEIGPFVVTDISEIEQVVRPRHG